MCRLIKGVVIIVPKLPQVIVVKKKSILNNQPAAGAENFLLGCPNATFGQFAPKPYICNVWHQCPNAIFGQFAPKPYICNVWHPLELL